MQILAFDFGTKFIGIAVGQTITKTSSPLMILDVAKEGKEMWNTIKDLINEWKPDKLLIGNPLNMDGTKGAAAQSIKDKIKLLCDIINLPMFLWDERLSTVGAFNLSSQLDINVSKRVKNIDQNSATFILQGVLDFLSK